MKKLLYLVVSIAVLGAIAYGISYTVSRYLVSKLDGTGGVSAPASSGLAVFDSAEFGLSFQYPEAKEPVIQNASKAGEEMLSVVLLPKGYVPPQGGEGPPAVAVSKYSNPKNLSIEEWVKTDARSNWQLAAQDGGLGSTSVGGNDALAYRHSGLYETSAVVAAHEGYIYLFTAQWMSAEDPIHAEFEALLRSVSFK